MELKFRDLRADEIECRVGTAKEAKDGTPGGISLLLYKDARCDMAILDETVGAMNWQRHHNRDNANCIISIWDEDKKQWIEKEDTGTESKTEAEKGLASDSYKRCAVNWGIGRELYTAPFIWIAGASKYDKFGVAEIEIENKKITSLVIKKKDFYGNLIGEPVYEYPQRRAITSRPQRRSSDNTSSEKKTVRSENNGVQTISAEQAESVKNILAETNSDVRAFLQNFKIASVDEMNVKDYPKAQRLLKSKLEQIEAERSISA